mmetsp:Transcript_24273/g.45412  ORF Transcript_24273/g.45412 Transcript_24273/m.45412 type:complete len:107 (-) Transcript_24273:551-871(-)
MDRASIGVSITHRDLIILIIAIVVVHKRRSEVSSRFVRPREISKLLDVVLESNIILPRISYPLRVIVMLAIFYPSLLSLKMVENGDPQKNYKTKRIRPFETKETYP